MKKQKTKLKSAPEFRDERPINREDVPNVKDKVEKVDIVKVSREGCPINLSYLDTHIYIIGACLGAIESKLNELVDRINYLLEKQDG